MWQVFKRRGRFLERLTKAPSFADCADAEAWARAFLESHPEQIQRGLEAVEVRYSGALAVDDDSWHEDRKGEARDVRPKN